MDSAGTRTAAGAAVPWVERYRPKSLKDVSHQTEVVSTLQNAVATGRLPHLLFYGPPGSGKTSVALALCRQLWHPSQWKRRVLELNASDERGISVVRDKIKHFASLSVGGSGSKRKSGNVFFQKQNASTSPKEADAMAIDEEKEEEDIYPNPPFKVIILDEADTMTPDAQAALRRIIEAHSKITRFILICNYVTRIIEPLASRCAKFRFQPLPPASMKDRLSAIADAEQCQDDEIKLLDTILEYADGDMRRAVTTLQSVHSLAVGGAEITAESLAEIAGIPPQSVLQTLLQSFSSNSFDTMQATVDQVICSGYSALSLLSALLPMICSHPQLTECSKAELAIRMAQAEKNMMQGADEYLQFMTVCSLALTSFAKSKQQLQ